MKPCKFAMMMKHFLNCWRKNYIKSAFLFALYGCYSHQVSWKCSHNGARNELNIMNLNSAQWSLYVLFIHWVKTFLTVPIDRIISVKNAQALVSMYFKQDKHLAPRTIEKMKILGAVLELPAKQHCQSSPFTSKLG